MLSCSNKRNLCAGAVSPAFGANIFSDGEYLGPSEMSFRMQQHCAGGMRCLSRLDSWCPSALGFRTAGQCERRAKKTKAAASQTLDRPSKALKQPVAAISEISPMLDTGISLPASAADQPSPPLEAEPPPKKDFQGYIDLLICSILLGEL